MPVKLLSFILLLFQLIACQSYKFKNILPQAKYDILPETQSLIPSEGYFILSSNTSFLGKNDLLTELKKLASNSTQKFNNNQIELAIINNQDFGLEGYHLNISKNKILLTAASDIGLLRGLQSIKQLAYLHKFNEVYHIPCATIKDFAKFKHRGLLLDCSRHFFSVETVKKYIDLLALYKMNTLHWHLTEDQGWRVEIDKYPKLNEIASFRKEKDGSIYGGYYTKKEIKEIVDYASKRQVQIIPEIELPGHSQAAIAAYPHLSCTGNQVEVVNDWGVFKEIYCAGNDSVFQFLEDVLTEVIDLFPANQIHIGGDEAPKTRWEQCSKCQNRIEHEGLHDEHELQSYFIKRIQTFLKSKGKEMIGWDEILEGGLDKEAIVQSWRGYDGGIEAAKQGNRVIMSPTSHAYLDYDLKAIDLKKVYSFDPIPAELTTKEAAYIIGGECNMWTEHVPDEKTLDQKVFPRMLAMSEVLWRYPQERDFKKFSDRMQNHYQILDLKNVKYGNESIPFTFNVELKDEQSLIVLQPYSNLIELNFQEDCETCDTSFKPYKTPIQVLKSMNLNVQPIKDNKKYGPIISIPFEKHEAIGASVIRQTEFSDYYTAGGKQALVDSKLGTLDFRDGAWQGFWGKDAEFILFFQNKIESKTEIAVQFYQYNNSWIFLPVELIVEISNDPVNGPWVEYGRAKPKITPEERGKHIETFRIKTDQSKSFHYLRVKAKTIGKVPDWHEAAGSDAWVFISEIIVK